jgi:hypothetical protein
MPAPEVKGREVRRWGPVRCAVVGCPLLHQGEVGESEDRQGEQFRGDVAAEFPAGASLPQDRRELADERRLGPHHARVDPGGPAQNPARFGVRLKACQSARSRLERLAFGVSEYRRITASG